MMITKLLFFGLLLNLVFCQIKTGLGEQPTLQLIQSGPDKLTLETVDENLQNWNIDAIFLSFASSVIPDKITAHSLDIAHVDVLKGKKPEPTEALLTPTSPVDLALFFQPSTEKIIAPSSLDFTFGEFPAKVSNGDVQAFVSVSNDDEQRLFQATFLGALNYLGTEAPSIPKSDSFGSSEVTLTRNLGLGRIPRCLISADATRYSEGVDMNGRCSFDILEDGLYLVHIIDDESEQNEWMAVTIDGRTHYQLVDEDSWEWIEEDDEPEVEEVEHKPIVKKNLSTKAIEEKEEEEEEEEKEEEEEVSLKVENIFGSRKDRKVKKNARRLKRKMRPILRKERRLVRKQKKLTKKETRIDRRAVSKGVPEDKYKPEWRVTLKPEVIRPKSAVVSPKSSEIRNSNRPPHHSSPKHDGHHEDHHSPKHHHSPKSHKSSHPPHRAPTVYHH